MRRLRTALVASSAVVFLLCATLHVASYWRSEAIQWNPPKARYWFMSTDGAVVVYRARRFGVGGGQTHTLAWNTYGANFDLATSLDGMFAVAGATLDWKFAGFRLTSSRDAFLLVVPIWMIAAITLPAPVRWILRWFLWRGRHSRGQCPQCGYDLRASTSGTCPECGATCPARLAPVLDDTSPNARSDKQSPDASAFAAPNPTPEPSSPTVPAPAIEPPRSESPRSSPPPVPPAPCADKASLRRQVKVAVEAMSPEERAGASLRICARVLTAPFVEPAATVMLYWPLPLEVDVRPLVEACLMLRLRVCLPRVDWTTGTGGAKGGMEAVAIESPKQLVAARHGIMQPPPSLPALRPEQLDLVIVPGLSFDPRGMRLGRGGGFYDRFLADPALGAFTCAVAFGVQLLDALPATHSDVPVRAIATEDKLIMVAAQASEPP